MCAPRVLIVDSSDESREVLSTLLELRGAETVESERAEQAAQLADRHQPDLIVFDADSDGSKRHEATRRLGAAAEVAETPIIVLGSVHRRDESLPTGQFVPKPYHYGPLIRRIEDLLASA